MLIIVLIIYWQNYFFPFEAGPRAPQVESLYDCFVVFFYNIISFIQMLVTNNTPNVQAPFGRGCMLMQTSLHWRADVSSLVCGMHPHWSLILHVLHTTVILVLHMRMFMINNQIQLFYTSNKITPWRLWYRFGSHGPYALCGYIQNIHKNKK